MKTQVIVLGAHPLNGFSMLRYTRLLQTTYEEFSQIEVRQPSVLISSRLKSISLVKLAKYLEGLVVFPLGIVLTGRHRKDVLHVADHSDAIWLLLPVLRGRFNIVTCHDLIAIRAGRGEIPEHRPKLSGRVYQRLISAGLRRADLIMADSLATADDVDRLFPGLATRVVRLPVDPIFNAAQSSQKGTNLPPSTKEYALVVGLGGWRKRRRLAVEVWKQLRTYWPGELDLVIVGPNLDETESVLLPEDLRSSCHLLTGLSEDELVAVYRESAVLIQASKYEGFAWPIVEANTVGTTALCADEPVLREAGGEANVYFDASMEAMNWAAIVRQLRDPKMKNLAINNSKKYNLEIFKTEFQDVIHDILR